MSEAAKQRFFRLVEKTKSADLTQGQKALTEALRATPKDPNILHLAAQFAERMQDGERALLLYRRALGVVPHWFEASMNLARVVAAKGDRDEAIRILEDLAPHHPQRHEIPLALAGLHQARGDVATAVRIWGELLFHRPEDMTLLGNYHFGLRQLCDWGHPLPERAAFGPRLTAVFYDDPQKQKETAVAFCKEKFKAIRPLPEVYPYLHERTRVGYISSDFHAHATSWLMAELFELQDRSKFEVFVYSYGIEDHSPIRQRLRDEADHFIELNKLTAEQSAQKIRDDEIDILIDLKGHTHGAHLDILAYRPAPCQLHWLGFPATTGADFIDGFIADPITIPTGAESFFTEKVWRMPHCYQINDRSKEIAEPLSKTAYGLPAEALVLASFNQTYKITPEMFDVWCDLLREVPDSVLWLYASNPQAPEHLRREAEKRGVDPARLVFAEPTTLPEHLARYHVVDIALDTFPVGGHTTTSDALWVGAPVVTLQGKSFVSRVAASAISAANLGYLVTDTAEAYKKLVLELARDADKRTEIRDKLRRKHATLPLFDTPLFVNAFEALLLKML
ncbi:MAG: hypothetical protein AB7E52_04375 [Bdellovibrionales bacterium]